jgi:nuclear transport factor 2 (NTF2) superfamily protein
VSKATAGCSAHRTAMLSTQILSAVEFWYEYSESDDPCSQWYRTYGLEHWVFGPDGRMSSRQVSEPPTIRSHPR